MSEQSQWDTNWTQKRTRRRPPCVRVIVFSKDRAFQLGQYLRTLFAKNRGASLDVHVLYRADSPEMEARDFVASYLRVKDAFPKVHFEREVDFATQVRHSFIRANFIPSFRFLCSFSFIPVLIFGLNSSRSSSQEPTTTCSSEWTMRCSAETCRWGTTHSSFFSCHSCRASQHAYF